MNKQTIDDEEIADDENFDSSDSTIAPPTNDASKSSDSQILSRKESQAEPASVKSSHSNDSVNPSPEKPVSAARWFTFQIIASSILFFGTIAIVVLLLMQRKSPGKITDKRQAPLVECVAVAPYRENLNISISGIAAPFREINIAAEVTGAITVKNDECKSGRFVKAGTHLLSIDSDKYKLAKERLVSELAEAEARQKRAEVELQGARDILELLVQDLQYQSTENQTRENLYQKNAISETELTNSRRSLITAKNAEKSQRNRVATLEADLTAQKSLVALKKVQQKEAEIDFNKAIINAPADGVIIAESVQKDDFVQAGTPLFVFEDTSAVEVKCDLRADQLQTVLDAKTDRSNDDHRFKLPPLVAKITYESNNEKFEWTGVLERYDGLGLDERTRTAPCRILVTNTKSKVGNRTLVRGMYVSVELVIGERSGLLALPADTVRAGNVVWINENETLKKQKIKVLNRVTLKNGSEAVIIKADKEGIQEGQSIVLSPIPQPTDGMKLRIMVADESTDSSQSATAKEQATAKDASPSNMKQDSKSGEPS